MAEPPEKVPGAVTRKWRNSCHQTSQSKPRPLPLSGGERQRLPPRCTSRRSQLLPAARKRSFTTQNRLTCRESQNKGDAVTSCHAQLRQQPAPPGPQPRRDPRSPARPGRAPGIPGTFGSGADRGCSLPLASAFRGASIPRRSPDGTGSSLRGRGGRRHGRGEEFGLPGEQGGGDPGDGRAPGHRPGGHHSPGKTCPSALGKSCRKKTIAATPVILPRSSPALPAAAEPLPPRRSPPHWWLYAAAAPAAGAAVLLGGAAGVEAGGERAGGAPRAQRRPRPRRAGPAAPPRRGHPRPPPPGQRLPPRPETRGWLRAVGCLCEPGCAHAQRPAVAAGAQHRAAQAARLLLPCFQRGWRGSAGAGVKRRAGIGGGIGAGMGWRERPSAGGKEAEVGPPKALPFDGAVLRAAHGHLQLKIVIPILIHFTFGSSPLRTDSHRALGTPRAQAQGRETIPGTILRIAVRR